MFNGRKHRGEFGSSGVGFYDVSGQPGEYVSNSDERKRFIRIAIATAAFSVASEEAGKIAAEEAGYPADYNPWKSISSRHNTESTPEDDASK